MAKFNAKRYRIVSIICALIVSLNLFAGSVTEEEALQKADEILAEKGITNGKILAIPDGVSVMVL